MALAVPAGASAAKDDKDEVTVMSRNIYLGSDLGPAINAPDDPSGVDGAGEIYNEVARTNFPERAVLLANEIKDGEGGPDRRPGSGTLAAADPLRPRRPADRPGHHPGDATSPTTSATS